MLDVHTWYLILYDLSLDAIRPYLSAMGLGRAPEAEFAKSLQSDLQSFQRLPIDQRNESQFVENVLERAQHYGQDYRPRLIDWSETIYPTQLRRQQQIFRWRAVIMRGAVRRGRGAPTVPQIVKHTRLIVSRFAPFSADQLKPTSEWDAIYCADREDEGISAFEWIEAAVRTYRFLFAWSSATKDINSDDALALTYAWALGEAELLRIPSGSLDRPEEVLLLPDSLRSL